MKKINGLYGYFDNKYNKVIYIGKDNNLHNNLRHKQHYIPCRKNEQQINTILQNDKDNRYEYFILISGNFTQDELNELESEAISLFGTNRNKTGFGWNFTNGGEGFDSETLKHRWNSSDFRKKHGLDKYRVISRGNDYYSIVPPYDSQKFIKDSKNKKFLEDLVLKLNNGEMFEEDVVKLKLNYSSSLYHVISNGGGNFALVPPNNSKKHLKTTNDKQKLELIANKLNNNEITENDIPQFFKQPYRIVSCGKDGFGIKSPENSRKTVKLSIDKPVLNCLKEMLNNGEITESMVRNRRWFNRFKNNFNNGVYVFFGI